MADIILQLLLGWLVADFLSGVLHWLEDRILWTTIPAIGRHVVEPNRLHHSDPMAFARASVLSRNSTTWIPVAAIAALWFWLGGFSFVWLGALLGGLVVTEVHVLAHRGIPRGRFSAVIGTLQDIGIIQSPIGHWDHHRGDMDRAYCVLTDWLNPIFDRLKVWRRLEALLLAIGLEPNRGTK